MDGQQNITTNKIGNGLTNLRIVVRFPTETRNFSFVLFIDTGSGDHPASFYLGITGAVLEAKTAGT
jgi:hypothetical protein